MLTIPAIALARPHQAPAIAAMSRDLIEHGLGWSWTVARVLHAIHDTSTNVAVSGTADQLQAFGIMQYGMQNAHLALLAVQPSLRHQGLGRQLVEWLERSARVAGLVQVRLEARADNESAMRFYEHLGFRRGARVAGYYEGRFDAVRMNKALG